MTKLQPTDRIGRLAEASVVALHADDSLRALAELMQENGVGAVLVRGTNGVVGIASERDVIRAIAEGSDLDDDRAGDVMTPDPIMVNRDETIAKAAEVMVSGGIRHLAVRDQDGIAGFVSIRDVLAVYS